MRLLQRAWGPAVTWQLNGGTIKDFESPVNNPVAGHGGGGGAVVVGPGDLFSSDRMTFENCTSNSVEERAGGAISVGGSSTVTLKNSTYKNNTGSSHGGAITVLLSDVRIENCVFDNNKCTVDGGSAIYVDGCKGAPTEKGGLGEIIGCTFTNNTSFNFGAVFLQGYNEDQWFVKNCQFTNNKATKAGSMAGALWHSGLNNGRFDVSNSTFENNEARTHGGAITCTRGSNNFTNCTFYGNLTRDAGGLGGGIYNIGDAESTWFSTITNCTFVNNIAGGYGGAWCITGSKGSVKNTIIANNKAYQQCGYPAPAGCVGYNNGNNCAGLLANNGNNLEYPERPKRVANPNYADPTDNPCFERPVVLNSSAMPVIDPRLSAPANNGGPTRTMALQAGSPAINAGNGCLATDQRGAPRVGTCDVGAFEFGATALAAAEPAAARPDELGLYPNPSSGEVFLTLPATAPAGPVHVRVYALSGQLVLEQFLDPRQPARLRVPGKGLFLVKATVGQRLFVQKLATY
jgi:predicted outer membrane repeat protein